MVCCDLIFPGTFPFQLTNMEYEALMLQIARSKTGRGAGSELPWHGFTLARQLGTAY
jgi:hypothetical protein